jgi:L-alanine-DL-glutamate epimerase-like enolase superfamily enzyme
MSIHTTIDAQMQLTQVQSRRFGRALVPRYTKYMRDEQKPIAAWIERTLIEKKWTAYRWAKETKGKVSATTITRATDEEYESITSIRVLSDLATAANVDPPIVKAAPIASGINALQLAEVLPYALAVMGCESPTDADLTLGARFLQSALEFLSGDPETAGDPQRLRSAMRAMFSTRPPAAY